MPFLSGHWRGCAFLSLDEIDDQRPRDNCLVQGVLSCHVVPCYFVSRLVPADRFAIVVRVDALSAQSRCVQLQGPNYTRRPCLGAPKVPPDGRPEDSVP